MAVRKPSDAQRRDLASELREVFENALTQTGGQIHYRPAFDPETVEMLKKDSRKHIKSISELLKDFCELLDPKWWKQGGSLRGGGSSTGNCVGRTSDGVAINKRPYSDGGRMFVIAYVCEGSNATIVKLMGYVLPTNHDKWKEEVRRIAHREGSTILDDSDLQPFDSEMIVLAQDSQTRNEHHHWGNYSELMGLVESFDSDTSTEKMSQFLDTLNESHNLNITWDQFLQIADTLPLLIDGHAGSGKSVILAMRVVQRLHHHYSESKKGNNESLPKILVMAYSRTVIENIEKFVNALLKVVVEDWSGHDPNNRKSKIYLRLDDYLGLVDYTPTRQVYHSLLDEDRQRQIPIPDTVEGRHNFVMFSRFQSEFFVRQNLPRGISAEQAWYFIRGIIKGQGHGIPGHDPLTIDDFRGGVDTLIDRKFTEGMEIEEIEEALAIFDEYEKWRMKNNYIDDLDLVRYAREGLDKGRGVDTLYDEIYIDEAQDLTKREFETLTSLLKDPWPKMIIAGDPLQTVNPTGFAWGILNAFISSYLLTNGFQLPKLKPQRMTATHRMPTTAVEFANTIIHMRNAYTNMNPESTPDMTTFSGARDGFVRVVEFDPEDSEHCQSLSHFIQEAITRNIGIIAWARDSLEMRKIRDVDSIISQIDQQLKGEKLNDDGIYSDNSGALSDIYSIETVKGLEFDSVILYRFGDFLSEFTERFRSVSKKYETGKCNEFGFPEQYAELYFLNRLFVSITRHKRELLIIDDAKTIDEVWSNTCWPSQSGVKTLTLPEALEQVLQKDEPSLQKAKNLFQDGKSKQNLELLERALRSAEGCPPSSDQESLLNEIKIRLFEHQLGMARANNDRKMEQHYTNRLAVLYDEHGAWKKAASLHADNQDWKQVYRVITDSIDNPDNLYEKEPESYFMYQVSRLHVENPEAWRKNIQKFVTKDNREQTPLSRCPANRRQVMKRGVRQYIRFAMISGDSDLFRLAIEHFDANPKQLLQSVVFKKWTYDHKRHLLFEGRLKEKSAKQSLAKHLMRQDDCPDVDVQKLTQMLIDLGDKTAIVDMANQKLAIIANKTKGQLNKAVTDYYLDWKELQETLKSNDSIDWDELLSFVDLLIASTPPSPNESTAISSLSSVKKLISKTGYSDLTSSQLDGISAKNITFVNSLFGKERDIKLMLTITNELRDSLPHMSVFRNPVVSKLLIECYQNMSNQKLLATHLSQKVYKLKQASSNLIPIENPEQVESCVNIARFVDKNHKGSSVPQNFWDRMAVLLTKEHQWLDEMRDVFSSYDSAEKAKPGVKTMLEFWENVDQITTLEPKKLSEIKQIASRYSILPVMKKILDAEGSGDVTKWVEAIQDNGRSGIMNLIKANQDNSGTISIDIIEQIRQAIDVIGIKNIKWDDMIIPFNETLGSANYNFESSEALSSSDLPVLTIVHGSFSLPLLTVLSETEFTDVLPEFSEVMGDVVSRNMDQAFNRPKLGKFWEIPRQWFTTNISPECKHGDLHWLKALSTFEISIRGFWYQAKDLKKLLSSLGASTSATVRAEVSQSFLDIEPISTNWWQEMFGRTNKINLELIKAISHVED